MHTNKTLHAVEELKEQGLPDNGMFIMCGPCNFCEECKAKAKEPCVNETMRFRVFLLTALMQERWQSIVI
mgnify:CR=1 FL=1